jgi:tetratricopeptide (TPR) repeat protein
MRTPALDALGNSRVLSSPEPLRLGSQLVDGRLHLVELLGRGGMGIVYSAFDTERQASVALKTMVQTDPVALYTFKKEFRALADLHHPNLVRLYELFHHSGTWFFTMELVAGSRFDAWVRPEARFDPARVQAGFFQLVEAIDAVHAAGKLHRDLKPSNVLVTDSGHLTVLDFGLVVETADAGEQTATDGQLVGTPAYLSPEQAFGRPATKASDLYAVGVMLFEAMTGRSPFVGDVGQILFAKQQSAAVWPVRAKDELPERLIALCNSLLDRDPASRPDAQSLREHFSAARSTRRARDSYRPTAALAGGLIGRKTELRQLREAYRESLSSKAVVCTITGESGIGKSAVCRTFLDELVRSGHAVVLRGQCHERESVPFKAFDALVDGLSCYLRRIAPELIAALLPRDCASLTTLFPVLGRVEAFANAPERVITNPQDRQRRAFEAFIELLGRMRDRAPLVIYIDDLQWCDRDSMLLLRYLVRHADGFPSLLIFNHRVVPNGENDLLSLVLDAAGSSANVLLRSIALDRLSIEESGQLACTLLNTAVTDDLIRRIELEARGNPLLIAEFAQCVAPSGGQTSLTLCDAVNARLVHVSESARTLLSLVALSGRPIPLGLALDVAGANHEDVDALSCARLIRWQNYRSGKALVFFHDLLRERYRAYIPAKQARELYTALARACGTHEAVDAELRSEYFEGAGDFGNAAYCAIQAAARSRTALAFDHAAELYQKALALVPYRLDEELELRIQVAECFSHSGRSADAGAAYERAAHLANSDSDAHLGLLQRSAEQWLHAGHARQGLDLLAKVCSKVGLPLPVSTEQHATPVDWTLQMARCVAVDHPATGTPLPRRTALRLEVAHTAVIGTRYYRPSISAQLALDYLVEAQRAGDARNLIWALASVAMLTPVRSWRAELLARIEELSSEDGRAEFVALFFGVRGFVARRRGELRDARNWFSRALDVAHESEGRHWQELDTIHVYDQATAAALGDFADLAETTPALVEDAFCRGRAWTGANLSGVFGLPAWLSRDDVAGYRRVLEYARGRWGTHGASLEFDRTGYQLLRGDVVAAIYEGEPLRALRIVDQYSDASATSGQRPVFDFLKMVCSASVLARAHALPLGSSETDAIRYKLAQYTELRRVPNLRPFSFVFEAALALEKRDVVNAVSALRCALDHFERAQVGMHAAATRRRLGQLISGDEGRMLVLESDEFMTAQGVRNLEAMTEIHCPGCVW